MMPHEALVTSRLKLVPWSERHDELLVRLAVTPAVTRYIGDGRPWPVERALALSKALREHWQRHDFGWRAAVERESGRAIGLSALSFAGERSGVDPGEYEIGWWLQPSAWGRGLAREAAIAVRDDAFVRVGAPSLLARIQPANRASQGVAAALGLEPESSSHGRFGDPILVLRLTAERWRAANRGRD